MHKELDIPPICFNGDKFDKIKITDSAQKHYGDKSADYFIYVASTLDKQNRTPDGQGRDGLDNYHIVSHVTDMDTSMINEKYRDVCFFVNQSKDNITFYHGSQRDENQYNHFDDKSKTKQE